MMTKLSLSEMKAAMQASQTDFLALLDELSDEQLAQTAPDGWSVGVVMFHMSEAREHFAGDIETLVASSFADAVGRTLAHEGRVANIAKAEAKAPSKATLRTRLEESYQTIMAALTKLSDEALEHTITNQNPKFGEQPLWDFIGHFVIDHDCGHVAQAKAVSEGVA
ncbi:MAG: DinB family protein [Chloroflexota bacterium]